MENKPDNKKQRRTGQRKTVGRDKHLIRVFLERDTAGKRHYYTETFYGGARQAEDRIREIIRRHKAGELIRAGADSFETFINEWLQSKKLSVSETSYNSYCQIVDLYIRPSPLRKLLLARINADDVQRLYNRLREKNQLSVVTIRQAHRVLGMIFKLAVERKKLTGSPMVGVKLPKESDDEDTKPSKAMTADQVLKFLEAAAGSRFERLFHLAFHVGCRPGELLALKWDDLNHHSKTLRIDQSIVWRKGGGVVRDVNWYLKKTKTKLSRRTIAVTDPILGILAEQKRCQLEARLKAGRLWMDHGFIFTTEIGAPWAGWHLRKDFKTILKKAGLPWNFSLYSARHSVASLLIEAGVNIKAVSERLGHSRTAITMDVYAHVSEGFQREVSEEMDRILGGQK